MTVKIVLANNAGFCFGVNRAVKMCETLAERGQRAATLGPIIHNSAVVNALCAKGVRIVETPEQTAADELLVIRSHGVGAQVYEQCERLGIAVKDATCPNVARIHSLVKNAGNAAVIIIGDRTHPEVRGIVGHCNQNALIFADLAELKAADLTNIATNRVIMVAQTTFNLIQYRECVEYAGHIFSDFAPYDTVCRATRERQAQAKRLAESCEVCIVIGDSTSSNTKKLLQVCADCTRAFPVTTADDVTADMLKGAKVIGVTAGASTPAGIIEEVLTRMSDIIKSEGDIAQVTAAQENITAGAEEDLDFEQAVEQYLKKASRNQRYVGVVTSVLPNEVVVDIGTKQTGIVPADEMTDDSSVKLEDIVKKGDTLNLVAIKVNDQEGIVTLSKKRLDAIDGFNAVTAAQADGTVLEAVVAEKVNAGIIAYYKGVRIFIHESQATMHRGESLDDLIKKTVRLKITDVKGPHSVRGSIRSVLLDERSEKRDNFWLTVEEGQKFRGKVKSLTSYGAFVDLGGVDGMVHISELSWGRIKHPSDVVNVGDEIDVYVKSADRETRKISLGYKKAEDDPWNKMREVAIGTIFHAPVVSVVKYGAFVRIMPNIDGFIHISELSDEHVEKTTDVVNVGDEVDARLIGIDFDRHRVSLSLRPEKAEESNS